MNIVARMLVAQERLVQRRRRGGGRMRGGGVAAAIFKHFQDDFPFSKKLVTCHRCRVRSSSVQGMVEASDATEGDDGAPPPRCN